MVTSEFYLFKNITTIILLFFINSYDPDEHKWTDLPISLELGENFAATCLQNQLFVAYKRTLSYVICNTFDPATRQWTKMKYLEFDTLMPGSIDISPEIMNGELQILIANDSEIKVYKYDVQIEQWSKVSAH